MNEKNMNFSPSCPAFSTKAEREANEAARVKARAAADEKADADRAAAWQTKLAEYAICYPHGPKHGTRRGFLHRRESFQVTGEGPQGGYWTFDLSPAGYFFDYLTDGISRVFKWILKAAIVVPIWIIGITLFVGFVVGVSALVTPLLAAPATVGTIFLLYLALRDKK